MLAIRINLFPCSQFTLNILVNSYYFHHTPTQDFLEANQAVSFFIILASFRDAASVQSGKLENGQTQEKLVIKGETQDHNYVTIARYPMEMEIDEEWIEEMKQRPNISNRRIEFSE
jgi:hypothetical protein